MIVSLSQDDLRLMAVLLFPLILSLTRNFDLWEKREVLRGPTLQHLDDRPDHLKQLSLFH